MMSENAPHILARFTLEQAEDRYFTGRISADSYEAYRHVWATHPAHLGYSHTAGWTDPTGFPPEVLRIADEIRSALIA